MSRIKWLALWLLLMLPAYAQQAQISKEIGFGVLQGIDQRMSGLKGFAVLQGQGPEASSFKGYVVINGQDERLAKLATFVVLQRN